jgi:hypothetical protein
MKQEVTLGSRDEVISYLFRQDWTCTRIAKDLGVSVSVVSASLDRSGFPPRTTGTAPLPVDTDELVRRYRAGASTRSLAEQFGISIPTVRGRLRDEGVTLRGSRPNPDKGTGRKTRRWWSKHSPPTRAENPPSRSSNASTSAGKPCAAGSKAQACRSVAADHASLRTRSGRKPCRRKARV